MHKSIRSLIVLVVLLAIAAPGFASTVPMTATSAAQSDGTQIVVPAGETIKVGLATDLSNVIPEPGRDIANGGLIAQIEVNENGGIEGFNVELDIQDDRCDGADATNVANLFAADPQIAAVVGHVCSGASIPASAIYNDARIPMVSPSSTAPAFTAQGFDVVNRTAFSDAAQGVVDARYIYEVLGARSIAIVHDNSDYGKGLAEVVQGEFERVNGTVTAFEAIDPEDQDYRPVLTVLAADAPEVIFFGGYQNQAALMVAQMQEVGLEDAIFFSDDGVFTQTYIDQASDAAEGSYASFVVAPENAEANATFDARYEEEFGVAPDDLGPFHAQTYDAAMIIFNAIEAVAVVDDEGNLVINREELIQAIRDTEGYEGLTGNLSCSDTGECGAGEIGVNIVEGGEWVAVEVPAEIQFGADWMMGDMDDMSDDEMSDDEMSDEGDDEMSEDDMAMGTIVDIAVADGNFTNLVAAVTAAGLAETLSGEGPFTVFAPTDEVFAALPEGTMEAVMADADLLNSILLYHVVEGAVSAEDIMGMETLTTLEGSEITVEVTDDGVLLNGEILVVVTDIQASNGVIHVIAGVLVP